MRQIDDISTAQRVGVALGFQIECVYVSKNGCRLAGHYQPLRPREPFETSLARSEYYDSELWHIASLLNEVQRQSLGTLVATIAVQPDETVAIAAAGESIEVAKRLFLIAVERLNEWLMAKQLTPSVAPESC